MTTANNSRPIHWLTVLQFLLNGLGLITFWGGALSAFLFGTLGVAVTGGLSIGPQQALLVSIAMFALGAFLLPSLLYSLARLSHRPFPEIKLFNRAKERFPRTFFALMMLVLVGGIAAVRIDAWYLLPFFHILAATLPALWLIWLALRNLKAGSDQRKWATLTSGLTIGPLLAIIVEVTAAIILVSIALLYIGNDPEITQALELMQFSAERSLPTENSMHILVETLLERPFLIVLVFLQLSVVTPLIEELVKPLAVWILAFRGPLTPAAGFGLGVISGAGLAIIENLLNGATVDGWTETTVVRFGATAFHLATSGLMGWAIVRAKNERKYLQFLGTYLLVVIMHGLWNAAAIVVGSASAYELSGNVNTAQTFYLAGGLTFVFIGGLAFTAIYRLNRRLRTDEAKITTLPDSG